MLKRAALAIASLISTVLSVNAAAASTALPPEFEAVLDRNIAAVIERDYDALVETITAGDALLLIFPNGIMTRTRDEYLQFHREWFMDQNWTMDFERISAEVIGTYGHALYQVTYDSDGDGPADASQSYLSLGFRQERGEWKLVHDQNTRIIAND